LHDHRMHDESSLGIFSAFFFLGKYMDRSNAIDPFIVQM